MKKIIVIALIAAAGLIAYKTIAKADIGDGVLKKIEKQIEANKKAEIGATIVCPICHKKFEKKLLAPCDFDSDECREKYKKLTDGLDKVNDIAGKASNVAKDTKKSIEKNF